MHVMFSWARLELGTLNVINNIFIVKITIDFLQQLYLQKFYIFTMYVIN